MLRTLVIIPTLNEAGNIEPLISKLLDFEALDILIVDDKSSDGTLEIASSFRGTGRVFVLSRNSRRGRRQALDYAMKWAVEHDIYWHYFMEMDGDFSHNPQQIPDLLQHMPNFSIVIGSRYVSGARSSSLSIYRRVISILINQFARVLLRLKVYDITGGFRCYRRNAVVALLKRKIIVSGFTGNIEVLNHLVNDCQLDVREVPIGFEARLFGKSKFSFREVIDACQFFGQISLSRMLRSHSTKIRTWPKIYSTNSPKNSSKKSSHP